MQLGGKDPAYVRPDADLDYTVAELVDGAFFNSGQSCCAIEVSESVYVCYRLRHPTILTSESMFTRKSTTSSCLVTWSS
jgi:hypothetical protein